MDGTKKVKQAVMYMYVLYRTVVKQWNVIKEINTATGSDKEWQDKNAETTGTSLGIQFSEPKRFYD